MPPVPMTAKRLLRYAGKTFHAGEPFSARTGDDAKVLKAIGAAVYDRKELKAEAPVKTPEPEPVVTVSDALSDTAPTEYSPVPEPLGAELPSAEDEFYQVIPQTPVTEGSPEPDQPTEEPKPRKRRTYRRRDLTAEE